MATIPKKSPPILPKTREIALARTASSALRPLFTRSLRGDIQVSLKSAQSKKSIQFSLPASFLKFLFRALAEIAEGNAITLVPIHAELTTQEAAQLLNVSRPYLIQLLELGKIPFRKVGRHRRILFEEILKYQGKSQDKSRKARDQLIKLAQDMDLGY